MKVNPSEDLIGGFIKTKPGAYSRKSHRRNRTYHQPTTARRLDGKHRTVKREGVAV